MCIVTLKPLKVHLGAVEAHPGAVEAHPGSCRLTPVVVEAHIYSDKCHLQAMEANSEANEGFQWNHVDPSRAMQCRGSPGVTETHPGAKEAHSEVYEEPYGFKGSPLSHGGSTRRRGGSPRRCGCTPVATKS
jgi:hypothetical protein